jgi:hypothetical protein
MRSWVSSPDFKGTRLLDTALPRERHPAREANPQSLHSRITPWRSVHRTPSERLALCGLLWVPCGSDVAAGCVFRCCAALSMACGVRRVALAFLAGGLNGLCWLFGMLSRSSMAWRGRFDASMVGAARELRRLGRACDGL